MRVDEFEDAPRTNELPASIRATRAPSSIESDPVLAVTRVPEVSSFNSNCEPELAPDETVKYPACATKPFTALTTAPFRTSVREFFPYVTSEFSGNAICVPSEMIVAVEPCPVTTVSPGKTGVTRVI
jgi:hypothetical protein